MQVSVVEPGILSYEKEINGLKEMQEVVGGPITINLDRKAGQPVRLSFHLVPKLQ